MRLVFSVICFLLFNQIILSQKSDILSIDKQIEDAYKIRLSDSLNSKQQLLQAYNKASSIGYIEGAYSAGTKLCIFYYYSKQYDKALECYKNQLNFAIDNSYNFGIASGNYSVGTLYQRKSDYAKAIEHYVKALEHLEKDNENGPALLLKIYQNMGFVFSRIEDFDKAINNYKKALQIAKSLNNSIGIYDNYTNIATTYFKTNQIQSSLKVYDSLEKALENEDNKIVKNKFEVYVFNGKASAYLEQDDYNKALFFATKSYGLVKGDKSLAELESLLSLGLIYKRKRLFNNSEKHFQEALDLAIQLKNQIQQLNAYKGLYELYDDNQFIEKAYQNYKSYIGLKEEILNKETKNEINDISAKYEAKQKDNKLLEQKLQIEKNKNRYNTIIIVCVIVILILMLILIAYAIITSNYRKKLNKELTHKNTKLKETIIKRDELKQKIDELQNNIAITLDDNFGNRFSALKASYDIIKDIEEKEGVKIDSNNYILFSNHFKNSFDHLESDIKDLVWSSQVKNQYWDKVVERLGIITGTYAKINNLDYAFTEDIHHNLELPKYYNRQIIVIYKELLNIMLKINDKNYFKSKVFSDKDANFKLTYLDDSDTVIDSSFKEKEQFYELSKALLSVKCSIHIKEHHKGNHVEISGNLTAF